MSENVLFFVNVVTQPEKEPVHSMNDNDNENDNDKVQKSTAYTWLDCCCFNAAQIVLTPPAPRKGGPFLPFFGQAGQVDPLVGWRSCY